MAVSGKGGLGIPTLLFHEGEGLTLTIETRDGTLYKGRADLTEDNFNVSLYHCLAFAPDGREQRMERAFIRGSQIVFVVFPDVLKEAPYFERVRRAAQGRVVAVGLGKARLAAMQAKASKKTLEAGGSAGGFGPVSAGGDGRGAGGGGMVMGMGYQSGPLLHSHQPFVGFGPGGGGGIGSGIGAGVGSHAAAVAAAAAAAAVARSWPGAVGMPPASAGLGQLPIAYAAAQSQGLASRLLPPPPAPPPGLPPPHLMHILGAGAGLGAGVGVGAASVGLLRAPAPGGVGSGGAGGSLGGAGRGLANTLPAWMVAAGGAPGPGAGAGSGSGSIPGPAR